MSTAYQPYGNPQGYPMNTGTGVPTAQGPAAWGQGAPTVGGYLAYASPHPGYGYAQGYTVMPGSAAYPQQSQQQGAFLNFGNDRFVKGLLIGAAATYLLTNESVQRTAIKAVVQVWSALQGGIEEAKERFHDAEAELNHAAQSKPL